MRLIFKEGTKGAHLWWYSNKTQIISLKRDVTQIPYLPKVGLGKTKWVSYNNLVEPTTLGESTQTTLGLSHADNNNNKGFYWISLKTRIIGKTFWLRQIIRSLSILIQGKIKLHLSLKSMFLPPLLKLTIVILTTNRVNKDSSSLVKALLKLVIVLLTHLWLLEILNQGQKTVFSQPIQL